MLQTKIRQQAAYLPLCLFSIFLMFHSQAYAQSVNLNFNDLGTGGLEDVTTDLYPYEGFLIYVDSSDTRATSGILSFNGGVGAGTTDSISIYFSPSLVPQG
ncbi:MAG: hypothetical protein AAFR59_06720, partial [Bacteroidota bacterium]